MIEIDLTRMFESKCAVRCRTEDDARILIQAVREKDPLMVAHIDPEDTLWINDNTCYTLFYSDSQRAANLSRSKNIQWFVNHGYILYDFDELITVGSDIEESEQPIDTLFR